MIKIYVSRFNSETDTEPHLECYEIEKTPHMKVLDALQAINDKYDADISFQSSCRAGQCGSCGILFKGNGALACQKEIKDGAIIEPLNFPVIKDLIVAKGLPEVWDESERGRATSYAAHALLAKVYLYMKNYQEVVNELTPVVADINAKRNLSLVPMPQTFPNNLKTSKDIIFAVQYLKGGVGESAHQNNRYRNNDNGNIISLEQTEFESSDDNRKALVAPTGSGQRPGKFNAPAANNETSADFPVMRCAEVMLMYAEAVNELSTVPTQEALDALNAVRTNAGLAGKTLEELPTKETFRQAVYNERRLELALECDRWFDIVRTGQMATVFPGIATYRQLYPIPQTEIENVNDKTGWQNEGYTIE